MQELNWNKLRNAIKRRLRYRVEPQDLPDAVQEGCGFAWMDISENATDAGLAVWKAVHRVLRGHTLCYEPLTDEERRELRWQEPDYAGTQWYLRNRPGVSEYSTMISRPAGERILPMHVLRSGCHHR